MKVQHQILRHFDVPKAAYVFQYFGYIGGLYVRAHLKMKGYNILSNLMRFSENKTSRD
jgi:hypothetical protein